MDEWAIRRPFPQRAGIARPYCTTPRRRGQGRIFPSCPYRRNMVCSIQCKRKRKQGYERVFRLLFRAGQRSGIFHLHPCPFRPHRTDADGDLRAGLRPAHRHHRAGDHADVRPCLPAVVSEGQNGSQGRRIIGLLVHQTVGAAHEKKKKEFFSYFARGGVQPRRAYSCR